MLIVRRHGGRGTERIQQEMEEIFRSLVIGGRPLSRSHVGFWRPPVEVYASDTALVVTVEIAGVREDEVQVVVDESVLHVTGTRANPAPHPKRTYHEMGIAYGPFEAEVFLPFPIVLDEVEAVYENGFLRVTLPRAQATRIVPRGGAPATGEER